MVKADNILIKEKNIEQNYIIETKASFSIRRILLADVWQ